MLIKLARLEKKLKQKRKCFKRRRWNESKKKSFYVIFRIARTCTTFSAWFNLYEWMIIYFNYASNRTPKIHLMTEMKPIELFTVYQKSKKLFNKKMPNVKNLILFRFPPAIDNCCCFFLKRRHKILLWCLFVRISGWDFNSQLSRVLFLHTSQNNKISCFPPIHAPIDAPHTTPHRVNHEMLQKKGKVYFISNKL